MDDAIYVAKVKGTDEIHGFNDLCLHVYMQSVIVKPCLTIHVIYSYFGGILVLICLSVYLVIISLFIYHVRSALWNTRSWNIRSLY